MSYYHVWLKAHPGRDMEWLKRMLQEGFDIHHVDGNHDNDDPNNLVLIENLDHMMMHNGKRPSMGRVKAADLKKQKINRLAADITFAAFKIEEARQMMIAGVHHSVIISRLRLRFPT